MAATFLKSVAGIRANDLSYLYYIKEDGRLGAYRSREPSGDYKTLDDVKITGDRNPIVPEKNTPIAATEWKDGSTWQV